MWWAGLVGTIGALGVTVYEIASDNFNGMTFGLTVASALLAILNLHPRTFSTSGRWRIMQASLFGLLAMGGVVQLLRPSAADARMGLVLMVFGPLLAVVLLRAWYIRREIAARLTPLEAAAMRELLRGDHPGLEILRRQLASASVWRRTIDSAGFFTHLLVPAHLERLSNRKVIWFHDVMGSVNGGFNNATFELLIQDGALRELEGVSSAADPWPKMITSFEMPELFDARDLHQLDPISESQKGAAQGHV